MNEEELVEASRKFAELTERFRALSGIDSRSMISLLTLQLGYEIIAASSDMEWRTLVAQKLIESINRLINDQGGS